MSRTSKDRGRSYPLLGKVWQGNKIQDEITGHSTYENLTVVDEFGTRVEVRNPNARDSAYFHPDLGGARLPDRT